MRFRERDLNGARGLRQAAGPAPPVMERARQIQSLKSQGCLIEALDAEHSAIEIILQSVKEAVVAGASRAEVIEILNTSIDFCATHFADEEGFMRKCGDADLEAHAAAHRELLAKFIEARRDAIGEGLPLATLEAVDLLHNFHEHVRTYDRRVAAYSAGASPPPGAVKTGV